VVSTLQASQLVWNSVTSSGVKNLKTKNPGVCILRTNELAAVLFHFNCLAIEMRSEVKLSLYFRKIRLYLIVESYTRQKK